MNEEKDINFTGERYLPEVKGQIQLEHLHRYAYAKNYVEGKDVLDIACGEGYGSSILAELANEVIGVDVSKDIVLHAQQKYSTKNLNFVQGDCSSIPLEDNSIDVVVSFETIEHHDKHEEMMLEIKRVLRKEGKLILSSPNKYQYSDLPGYKNLYHVKELYREQLEELINRHFSEVELLSQRVVYGSMILGDKSLSKSFNLFSVDSERVIEHDEFTPTYDILIASMIPFGITENSLFEEKVDALFVERDSHIKTLSETLKSVIDDRDARSEALSQIQEEFGKRMKEKDDHINILSSSLNLTILDRDSLRNGKVFPIDEKNILANELIAVCDAKIQTLSELTSLMDDQQSKKDKLVIDLIEANDTKAKELSELKSLMDDLLSEKDLLVKELIEDRDLQLDKINKSLQIMLEERVKEYEKFVGEQTKEKNKHIEELLVSLNAVIEDRDTRIEGAANLELLIKQKDEHIRQLTKTLDAVIKDRDSMSLGLDEFKEIMNKQLLEKQNHIDELTSSLNSVIVDRDSRAEGVVSLELLLHQKDERINQLAKNLESVIVDRASMVGELEEMRALYESKLDIIDIQKKEVSSESIQVSSVSNDKSV